MGDPGLPFERERAAGALFSGPGEYPAAAGGDYSGADLILTAEGTEVLHGFSLIMKTVLAFIFGVIAGVFIVHAFSNHKQMLEKDPSLDYLTSHWLKSTEAYLPDKDWARNEIRENMAGDLHQWRTVSHDPRKVIVSKTLDTLEYVITVIDADGRNCELWLDEEGNIDSIGYIPTAVVKERF